MAKVTCVYESGTITAVTYDSQGKELGCRSLKTAGPETQLLAEPERGRVKPGELCYVRLRYTDEAGVTKPLERGMLKASDLGGFYCVGAAAALSKESGSLFDHNRTKRYIKFSLPAQVEATAAQRGGMA